MRLITYAGGEFMTGDDIAIALLDYGQALAEEAASESVEIPVLDADGTRGVAMFLVGPASQLVARNVETDLDELIDTDTVTRLRASAAALHANAGPMSADDVTTWRGDDL